MLGIGGLNEALEEAEESSDSAKFGSVGCYVSDVAIIRACAT